MKKFTPILSAMLWLSAAASVGVVRERVVPSAECGVYRLEEGARLVLPAFDGTEVALTLGRRGETANGACATYGAVDGKGVRRAVVTETERGFVASVRDASAGRTLVFTWDGAALKVAERKTAGGSRRCVKKTLPAADSDANDVCDSGLRSLRSVKRKALTGDPMVDGAAMLKGETLTNVVDVMLAFDKSAAKWVRGSSDFAGTADPLALFAADRVANMNNTLANSGLGDRFAFRLAGTCEVATDVRPIKDRYGSVDIDLICDYASGYRTDKNKTRAADWKKIRTARETYGADIVSVLVDGDTEGMVGIGFMLDDNSIVKKTFCDYAYNVCSVSVVAYDDTMTHECGHNMGAGHAEMSEASEFNSGPQLYDVSYGHYFDVTNAEGVVIDHCCSVMAYNDDGRYRENAIKWKEYANTHYVTIDGRRKLLAETWYYDANWESGFYREVSCFSSADTIYCYSDPVTGEDVCSGIPTGTEGHDNARVIAAAFPLVANFRLHKDTLKVFKSGTGTVSGGGRYVTGTKAKLKATGSVVTNKKTKKTTVKSVFCGWYADAGLTTPIPGAWQAASCTFQVPDGGASVYAKFLAPEDPEAKAISVSTASDFYVLSPGTSADIPLDIEAGCLPTAKASNLPAGLSLKQRADKTWYVAGKPTTPGEKKVTVTAVSAANKTGAKHTFRILVVNWRDDSVFVKGGNLIADVYEDFVAGVPVTNCTIAAAAGSTASIPSALGLKFNSKTGRVTGTPKAPGKYLVTFTRKVNGATRKATALFVVYQGCWDHSGDRGTILPGISLAARVRSAAGADEDIADGATNVVTIGVKQSIALIATGLRGVANTLVVKGLPVGLSFSKGYVTGVPTKAGTYKVTVSASNKWKWTGSKVFYLQVRALPSWAKGSFYGMARMCRRQDLMGTEEYLYAPVQLQVGTTGKISAKLLDGGGTAAFSMESYSQEAQDAFVAEGNAKVTRNRKTCTFAVAIRVSGQDGGEGGSVSLTMAGQSGQPEKKFGWDFAEGVSRIGQARWTQEDKNRAMLLQTQMTTSRTEEPWSRQYNYILWPTFGSNGKVNVKYRTLKGDGTYLGGPWTVTGLAIVAERNADGSAVLELPLMLTKPAKEAVLLRFFVESEAEGSGIVGTEVRVMGATDADAR